MNQVDNHVEALQEEMIDAIKRLIQIKSVQSEALPGMPFGKGVADALDASLAIAAEQGFKTVNLDGYVGYAEYGEGDDYVAILGHVDVVPEGSGWKFAPYSGHIHEGNLYGRGTIDDKGPIIAALFGLKALENAGVKLGKRVRIIFGTNEETGCKDMDYYNTKEKAPIAGFTPDGCFPVIFAEKGGLKFSLTRTLAEQKGDIKLLHISAGERVNIVPNYCEAELAANDPAVIQKKCKEFAERYHADISTDIAGKKLIVKAHGISAHASKPHLGKNAAMLMLAFLGELDLAHDISDYIQKTSKDIGFDTTGTGMGIAYEDEISGQLTLNAGILRMDTAKIRLTCDVRYPVTFDSETLLKRLEKHAADLDVELENVNCGKPLYYPQDDKLVTTLLTAFNAYTGLTAQPLAIGGGTYAKHMKNIVAFGPQFPDEPDLCHQTDEYINIKNLLLSAKIYAKAIYELAK